MRRVTLHSADATLRSTVVLGLVGIDGSGAALASSLARSRSLTSIPCSISTSHLAALQNDDESPATSLDPVMLWNDDEVSYMMLNLCVEEESCVDFVAACMEFIQSHFSENFQENGHLILLTSLRINKSTSDKGPFLVRYHHRNEELVEGCSLLPREFKLPDAMLSTWLHFAHVMEIKTTCFATSGHHPGLDANNLMNEYGILQLLSGLRSLLALPDMEFKPKLRVVKAAWNEGIHDKTSMYT